MIDQDTIDQEEHRRMRWAARRGMLELDLVLEPFVSSCYPQLPDKDRQLFQRLMECEDQDLFVWLMKRGHPDDDELVDIIGQILEFARRPPADR